MYNIMLQTGVECVRSLTVYSKLKHIALIF